MSFGKFLILALFAVCLVQCQRPFHVKIENLSGGAIVPTAFSDFVWALHTGRNPLFHPGQLASAGLQRLAEDGSGDILLEEARNSSSDVIQVGNIKGPVRVGTSLEFGLTASPGQRFSFVTMYVSSNDIFFAPSSGGVSLFDSDGFPVSATFEVNLFDAGTEVNEPPGSGINQAPKQPQDAVGQVTPKTPVSRLQTAKTNYSNPSALIRFTVTAATIFRARIENVGSGTPISPVVWAVSRTTNTLFSAGHVSSNAIRQVAENGNGAPLAAALAADRNVLFSGVAGSSAIRPGQFVEFTIPATPGTRFYLASMYGWSNDRFFSTPEKGVSLFLNQGPYNSNNASFIYLWDAGSAINEFPDGAQPNQARARHGQPHSPLRDEVNVVKEAFLGNPDGFTYQTPASTLRLSIAPVTNAGGFVSSNPNQNVYVNFKFANMFKFSS